MYKHDNVKTSPDFPIPDRMRAWVLGDRQRHWYHSDDHSGQEAGAAYRCSTRIVGNGVRGASWRMASYQEDPSYKANIIGERKDQCQRPNVQL